MQPKEPPLATRLPASVRERFDLYVEKSGLTKGAAAAALIELGLAAEAAGREGGPLVTISVGGGRKIPVEGAPANFTPNGAGVSMGGAMAAAGVQFGPGARAPRPKGGAQKKAGLLARLKGEKS